MVFYIDVENEIFEEIKKNIFGYNKFGVSSGDGIVSKDKQLDNVVLIKELDNKKENDRSIEYSGILTLTEANEKILNEVGIFNEDENLKISIGHNDIKKTDIIEIYYVIHQNFKLINN